MLNGLRLAPKVSILVLVMPMLQACSDPTASSEQIGQLAGKRCVAHYQTKNGAEEARKAKPNNPGLVAIWHYRDDAGSELVIPGIRTCNWQADIKSKNKVKIETYGEESVADSRCDKARYDYAVSYNKEMMLLAASVIKQICANTNASVAE